jgi:hypothetical protein
VTHLNRAAGNSSESTKNEKSAVRDIWLTATVAGLVCWCLSLISAAPSFYHLKMDWLIVSRAGDYLKMCANPLDRELREMILAYRPFPPLVAHMLGGGVMLSLLLPYFASIAMLTIVFAALRQRLGNALAWAATLLVASTSAITWPNCMVGYPDSFSHLLAALLLINRSRVLLFFCIVAGMMSDERFMLALPLVWLWHGGFASDTNSTRTDLIVTVAGLVCYALLRHGLKVGWIGAGIPAPKVYSSMWQSFANLAPYQQTWTMWWANVFGGFRWAAVVLITGTMFAWRKGEAGNVSVLCVTMLAAMVGSLMVFDVTRSIGFAFPALLVGTKWLAEARKEMALRILRWSAVICLVTPSYWVTEDFFVWWWRPLPLRALAYWTGEDPMRWLNW